MSDVPRTDATWEEYDPWRTGIIPPKQETRYSQYLLGVVLSGIWVPIIGFVLSRGDADTHKTTLLYLLAAVALITLLFLYRLVRSRNAVTAVLKFAVAPVAPGSTLNAEIIFERSATLDSTIELYLRAFTVRYEGLMRFRRFQPVGPTPRDVRRGASDTHVRITEIYRQVKEISPDRLRLTANGTSCPVDFDIPGDAAEASTRPARMITVWTLMCRSESFEFDVWFGNLPIFRTARSV
jgi:hypothetical protein